MDPLSCAASVLAVIQVAGAVTKICGDYMKQVKRAHKDINDLAGEINSLGLILESLESVLRGPRGGNLITLGKISDDAGKCELILKSLSHKINPETTQISTKKRWYRHWKWPLQRAEVDEAISQLKGYTALFVTALQIDHLQSHDRFERKFDLRNLKVAEGATYASTENKHNECLPETRTEVLRQVWDWAESSHGKCIYWLKGGAGTGKSTISRTIARQLDDKKLLGASFFFKRGEEGRNGSKWLFSTIAQQLATTIPELGPEIQKAIEEDPYISGKAPAEQFNKLLLQPLISLDLDRTVTFVAVIDALDECQSDADKDNHDIKVLLRLLPRVQESKSVRLRFFLTSRPELPLRLGFKAVKDNLQNMDLHNIPTLDIAHDISIFLDHSFSRIRENHDLPAEWPSKEAMNDLLARTVPLFISAATMCRFIGTTYDPQDRLQNVLNDKASYVSEMARTYSPVLNQLLVGQNKREAPQLAQRFRDIVGPIIVLATPLSVNGLSQLLGTTSSITLNNIKSLLNWLHSVIIVTDNPEVPIRLQHLSFRDFLVDSTIRDTEESAKFWIDEKVMHRRLTDQCLAFMDKRLKKNICMLPNDCLERSEIDPTFINEHLPPELRYTCRYWIYHLMKSHKPAEAVEKACSFLEIHYLHWIEVASILGLVSDVIRGIGELQSAAQDSECLKVRRDLLRDLRRFILKNRHLAEIAPLQLYSSGLMFCPESSFTRRIFKDNLSDWYRIPKVEPSWSAEQQTLEGHSGSVQSTTFSPDGKQLASGSYDKTIKLWDPTTGELQQTLEDHSERVWSVTFSPDGKQLASGSDDKTIKLWDPTTGELQQTLEGHSGSVRSVTFSPDGKQLASGSYDKTIKLWDPTTGELQQTLEGHSERVWSVTFSPDGKHLASGSDDHTIKLWDPTTGELRQTLEGHSGSVQSVTFSPNGRQIASGSGDNTIKLWDPTTGELQQTLEGHSDWVGSVNFSPDSKQLASVSGDNTIKLWDPITGELWQTLEGHFGSVRSVAFSPDGKQLASGSDDNTIKLWDPTTGELQQTLEGHSSWVRSVTFSSDGKQLASGSYDNIIKLWDPSTGELRHTLEGHSGLIFSVTFSPDGKQLASVSGDNTVRLWDSTTGELRQTLQGHSDWVWSEAGAGISILHDQWLCHRNRRILWLPQTYRAVCLAVNHGVLLLGHVSGRVSFISKAEFLD